VSASEVAPVLSAVAPPGAGAPELPAQARTATPDAPVTKATITARSNVFRIMKALPDTLEKNCVVSVH
jgi:hypothetical protein